MGSGWRRSDENSRQPTQNWEKVRFDVGGQPLNSVHAKQSQQHLQSTSGQWASHEKASDSEAVHMGCWSGRRKSREAKAKQAAKATGPFRTGRERICSAILRSSVQIHAEADESVHVSPAPQPAADRSDKTATERQPAKPSSRSPPLIQRVSGFFEGLLDTRGLFDSIATADIFTTSGDLLLDTRTDCPRPIMETSNLLEGANEEDDNCSGEEADTFEVPAWKIDPHDIYFYSRTKGDKNSCTRVGKGDYGPIYRGVWNEKDVAVKLARQKPISWRAERLFQKHISQLHGLRHPNVVDFHGACYWQGGKRTVLVTEHMDNLSLRANIKSAKMSDCGYLPNLQDIATGVARGLAYLHSKRIVHTRLKGSNVLLNREGVAKISDANLGEVLAHCKGWNGSSVSSGRSSGDSSGDSNNTFAWMAPEVVLGAMPDCRADIYSFGVLLWEMLTLELASQRTLRTPRVPEEATAHLADVQAWCCDRDPSRRPTVQQLVRILAKA